MLQRISSEKAPKAIGSYSIASKIGNFIYTSGQLPVNRETGKIEHPHSIAKQTVQVMENIKYILDENNSSMDNIIKTTVYLQNLEDFQAFNDAYGSYFSSSYPSRTAFEVGKLPMNAMIEIEVVAEVVEDENGEKY